MGSEVTSVSGGRATFLVTCYNYGRFVEQAVDSLLGQSYGDIEIIVIDDASRDGSGDLLRSRYSSEPKVVLVSHEVNKGHIYSYNEGLAMATGDYVGVLAADDYARSSDAVAAQIAVFQANPSVGFVYSAHELVNESGSRMSVSQPFEADYVSAPGDDFKTLVFSNYVPHSGTLVRRTCHAALGVYDERLPHSGDWDLWLRVAANYGVGYLSEPLYAYRIHSTNMSHSRVSPAQALDELLLTIDKNFALVQRDGNESLASLLPEARRGALFITFWNDLAHGRRKRSWQGLVSIVRRSPRAVMQRPFLAGCYRTGFLLLLGPRRFQGVFGGFND
ncbi:hypothetical protein AYO38_03440 [bacterium SCGC AG-212-C10]|nr:hypothetical protein AYO38_03440 [bacterium SCGC AG-212-C10]